MEPSRASLDEASIIVAYRMGQQKAAQFSVSHIVATVQEKFCCVLCTKTIGKYTRQVCVHSYAIFSERELTFTFAICYRYMLSVCLSSVCLSVTLVRPTQAVQIFRNISTALGTLAIHRHPLKILRRSSQGNPSAGAVKHKRGSKI